MKIVEFTQFCLPDGRQKQITTEVADDLAPQLSSIESVGARLEAEILTTGEVSLSISVPWEGNFDTIVVQNGPEVSGAVDKLIRRFSQEAYEKYITEERAGPGALVNTRGY